MAEFFEGDITKPVEKSSEITLTKNMIQPGQLKHLGILTSDIEKEKLKAWLQNDYGVDSRKKLTQEQANEIIASLEAKKTATTSTTEKVEKKVTEKVEQNITTQEQVMKVIEKEEEKIAIEIEDVGLFPDMILAYYLEWRDKKTGELVEGVVLSAAGIFEAATNEGLKTKNVEFLKVNEKLIARTNAEDPKTGAVMMGFASRVFNQDKAVEILSTISMRNAFKKLLNTDAKNKVIQKAKKKGLIKKLPIVYSR